jgi:hypothetical protein
MKNTFAVLVSLGLLMDAIPCSLAASQMNDSVSEWVLEDNQANRESLARWGKNFLRLNETASEHRYLQGSLAEVHWQDDRGQDNQIHIAQSFYDPSRTPPFRIELNAAYWFKVGRERGETTSDLLRFVLLHERYHLFCHTREAIRQSAHALMPVMERISSTMNGDPLSPDIEDRLAQALAALDEIQANVYAEEAYKRILKKPLSPAVQAEYDEFTWSSIQFWSQAILGLKTWESLTIMEISKRLGFDWTGIDPSRSDWQDQMISRIHAIPGAQGCQWLWHAYDYVLAKQ